MEVMPVYAGGPTLLIICTLLHFAAVVVLVLLSKDLTLTKNNDPVGTHRSAFQ